MILLKLDSRGWPFSLVSADFSGPAPSGHATFADFEALDAWKAAHEGIRPENFTPKAGNDPWSTYESALAAGYTDQSTGLHLKTEREAQTLFTSQVTLLQLAVTAKVAPATVDLWDASGTKRTLALADFFALMLRYGLYCQQLFATRPIV